MDIYKFLVKSKTILCYEILREQAPDILKAIQQLVKRYDIPITDIIMVQKD